MNFLQNLLVRGDEGAAGEPAVPSEPAQPQLSQDELRRRRLARLGGGGDAAPGAAAADTQTASASGTPSTTAVPSPSVSPPAATSSSSSSASTTGGLVSPVVRPTAATSAVKADVVTKAQPAAAPVLSASSPQKSSTPMPASTSEKQSPAKQTSASIAPQTAKRNPVNDALVQFLRISLSPTNVKGVTYLPSVASETKETMLTEETVDAALYGWLYTDINDLTPRPTDSPLRYILGCMERYPAVRRNNRADETPEVASALEAARKLLINFVVTYLTEPGLFSTACLARWSTGGCAPEHEMVDLLRRQETGANTVHLLQMILPEVLAQKCGKDIVLPILQKLSQDQKASKDEPFEYALSQLCAARVEKVGGWGQFVAEILADERQKADYEKRRNFFDINMRGRRFEEESILGPFFSAPQITIDPKAPTTKDILQAKRSLLHSRLSSLKQAVMDICKAGELAREDMLKWFEQALELNAERSKERPDKTKISSEPFANNLCSVLLHLCEPFLSNEKSTAILPGLISEASDCIAACKAFPTDLTKLKRDGGGSESASATVPPANEEEEKGKEKRKAKKFKFPTKAFVLTLRAVDLGPVVSYRTLGILHRQARWMHDDHDEQDEQYKSILALITTYVAFGFEPNYVDQLLSFASLVSRWFTSLQLGLTGEAPSWNDRPLAKEAWGENGLNPKLWNIPEFIVGNVADIFVQVGQHDPTQIDPQGSEKLRHVLDFFILMIGSGDAVVGQPHVRANMGDALFYVFLPDEARRGKDPQNPMQIVWPKKGIKENVLENSLISQAYMVPALMRLYGDVQVTGYYQVAAHRQLLTRVLGYLWTLDPHRPAFRTFAETSLKPDATEDSAFVKLANGILNQTNSNVAESLAKLREIRKTQIDMKNAKTWSELSEEERNQRTVLLESNEKEVSACLTMANDATDMLSYLSTDPTFVKAFTVPALRSRLVDMLCNILASLGSKKAAEFKIDNPEKYNFFPKKMLEEVFQTLLNCAKVVQGGEEDAKNFVRSVANSAYYDFDTFTNAAKLVRKHGIVQDEKSLDLFTKFVDDCAKAKEEVLAEEAALGEVPDEFLDPLMSTLMDDPVVLPGSKVTVDRSTIMHHLLQNSNDPFDRSPLEASQLKDDVALKEKIQAWKTKAKQ